MRTTRGVQEGGQRTSRSSWGSLALALLATCVTTTAGIIVGGAHGRPRLIWGAVAVVAAACAFLQAEWRGRRLRAAREDATQARAKLRQALTTAAQPLIGTLAELAAAPDDRTRHECLGRLQVIIVDTAATQCGRNNDDQTRSALYLREDGPCLRLKAKHGRVNDAPRERYCRRDGDEGKEVMRVAEGTRGELFPDIRTSAPKGVHDAERRSYRSFASAPVRAGNRSYGLLTVDCPAPGALGTSDLTILNILASALGAGMAIESAAQPATPYGTANIAPRSSQEGPSEPIVVEREMVENDHG